MNEIGYILHVPLEKRKRARGKIYRCDLLDCPLLAQRQCINRGVFDRCIYGDITWVDGWTPRAKKYTEFVQKWRKLQGENPLGSPPKTVTYVGDYVWLPYSFMTLRNGASHIPFKKHSAAFSNGIPFIHLDKFTPEMVVNLANMRPQAHFGGEIRDYQEGAMPRFLTDLLDYDPGLFHDAAELEPRMWTIVEGAEVQSVTIGILLKHRWYGRCTIDGRYGFLFRSGSFKTTVNFLQEFPGTVNEIEVTLEYPSDTPVILDQKEYLKIKAKLNR